jgi:hypothetical protein
MGHSTSILHTKYEMALISLHVSRQMEIGVDPSFSKCPNRAARFWHFENEDLKSIFTRLTDSERN